jgi:excisionase family DNA binding protein
MERQFLTVAQVSYELGVTSNRVYQLIAEGEIPSIRLGRMIRIPRERWEEWIEAKKLQSVGGIADGK